MLQIIFSKIKSFLKIIYLIIVTLPRDLKGLLIMRKIESKIDEYEKSEQTVPKLFYKMFKKHPKKPCFIFDNTVWSFEDVCKKDFYNYKKTFI